MDKILMYTLREEDLAVTAGGVVNLILRNCVHVTGHEISRAKFAGGGITADGMPVTVKDRIRPGQTLRVTLPEREPKPTEYGAHVVPEKPPEGILQFLYEDEDLVALNKPAGTVVHPTHGHWHDTLGNYLAYYYGEQGEDVVCHVAGRLDMDTSGVLVFAKNRAARISRFCTEALKDKRKRRRETAAEAGWLCLQMKEFRQNEILWKLILCAYLRRNIRIGCCAAGGIRFPCRSNGCPAC